ncbi:MAG: DUF4815 domain-containing protein, partial [Betaproteobacteria bacterium]
DSAFYLRCSPSYYSALVDFTNFAGKYIVEESTGKVGYVKAVTLATQADVPTLHVSIISGNQTPFDISSTFAVYDTRDTSPTTDVYFNSIDSTSGLAASGTSLLFHIAEGVFYAKSTFLYCAEQTVVVGKYTKSPSKVIGLDVTETIADYVDDPSLLDPALGASNYLAPGADRYLITLELTTKDYTEVASTYQSFIQLSTVVAGQLTTDRTTPIYSTIMDTMAKRTYDTNGNFIVKNFLPVILDDAQNTSKLILQVSAGSAFVQGYEIETISPTTMLLDKARDTDTDTNYGISTTYGNYTYVKGISGNLPDINTTYLVEVHNVATGQSASSKIGTAYITNLEYVEGFGSSAVYALFLDQLNLTSTSFSQARSFFVQNSNYTNIPTFKAVIDNLAITNSQATIFLPTYNSLLFTLPRKYVSQLGDVQYFFRQKYTSLVVNSGKITFSCSGANDKFVPSSSPIAVLENFVAIDNTTNNFVPLDAATVILTNNDTQAEINLHSTAYNGHSFSIISSIRANPINGDTVRTKTLVSSYAGASSTVTNTQAISLLKSD